MLYRRSPSQTVQFSSVQLYYVHIEMVKKTLRDRCKTPRLAFTSGVKKATQSMFDNLHKHLHPSVVLCVLWNDRATVQCKLDYFMFDWRSKRLTCSSVSISPIPGWDSAANPPLGLYSPDTTPTFSCLSYTHKHGCLKLNLMWYHVE